MVGHTLYQAPQSEEIMSVGIVNYNDTSINVIKKNLNPVRGPVHYYYLDEVIVKNVNLGVTLVNYSCKHLDLKVKVNF